MRFFHPSHMLIMRLKSWTVIKELLKFLTPRTPKGVLTDWLCPSVALFLRSDRRGFTRLRPARGLGTGFTGSRLRLLCRLVGPELLQLSLIFGFHGYSMTHLSDKDRGEASAPARFFSGERGFYR